MLWYIVLYLLKKMNDLSLMAILKVYINEVLFRNGSQFSLFGHQ